MIKKKEQQEIKTGEEKKSVKNKESLLPKKRESHQKGLGIS